MPMRKAMRALLAAGALASLGLGTGCAYVTSAMPSSTSVTGEAWYTEATGFFGLFWGSKIFYCPAPTAAGPATCKEAKLVPLPQKK
jgi:hypothetical protein